VTTGKRPRLAVHEQRDVKEALSGLRAQAGLREVVRVERLAKHGDLHSDAEIAALALQWARAILAAEPRYSGRPLFVGFLTEILTGGFNQDGTRAVLERRSLRTATRIVRAHEATTLRLSEVAHGQRIQPPDSTD
jgi:hypothetical protein